MKWPLSSGHHVRSGSTWIYQYGTIYHTWRLILTSKRPLRAVCVCDSNSNYLFQPYLGPTCTWEDAFPRLINFKWNKTLKTNPNTIICKYKTAKHVESVSCCIWQIDFPPFWQMLPWRSCSSRHFLHTWLVGWQTMRWVTLENTNTNANWNTSTSHKVHPQIFYLWANNSTQTQN